MAAAVAGGADLVDRQVRKRLQHALQQRGVAAGLVAAFAAVEQGVRQRVPFVSVRSR
jgi:hypothetical protein